MVREWWCSHINGYATISHLKKRKKGKKERGMAQDMLAYLRRELATLHQQGLYKEERIITSPQRADIDV